MDKKGDFSYSLPMTKAKRGWRYWFNLLTVSLTLGGMLSYIGYVWLYVAEMTRPAPSPCCPQTPVDVGLAYEDVTFTSADGVVLSGWYVPAQNGAVVILVHGFRGNRTNMLPHAQMLAMAGYGSLLYDLRGHGTSGGEQIVLGWPDVMDVEAAVSYLQTRPEVNPDRFGIVGWSLGGQIALRAAAEIDAIQAVLADGPADARAKDWVWPEATLDDRLAVVHWWVVERALVWRTGVAAGTAVVDALPQIAPRPILIVMTGDDSAKLTRHFYEVAGEPKTLWELPDAVHGGGFGSDVYRAEYERRMLAFFDSALLVR